MEATENGQKRCVYSGWYYRPDPRARKIQKSCSDATCRAKRKRESQKKWLEANPDCFKGRYSKIKAWRSLRGVFLTSTSVDYQREGRDAMAKYYSTDFDREFFEHLIVISKIYKVVQFDIFKINIAERKPLRVEVWVKEWFDPEMSPPPTQCYTSI
jgi:hypothetical protein